MTLAQHLGELRRRLLRVAIAVAVAAIVGWFLYPAVLNLLLHPYRSIADRSLAHGQLIATGPLEGFAIRLKITAYTAIALAMPITLWQLWRFVAPGLYQRERRYAIPFVASALVLFCAGAAIAYATMPAALQWLSSVGGASITQAYTADKYFQLIAYMMITFGICFEFPILMIFLQLSGIVSNDYLRRHWRHAVVLISVVVAVATPSNDPISMFALAIPLWLFYGVALVVGRFTQRSATTP